jgi:hypothetical protein
LVTRHADVAGAVASGDIQAAAKRNGQMGEVTADTDAFEVTFRSGAVGSSEVIAKLEMVMHVIADGLNPLPAGLKLAEKAPGKIVQLLRVAITAAEQKEECIVRQIPNLMLYGVGNHIIRQSTVQDFKALRICRRPAGATRRVQTLPKEPR